MSTVKRMPGWLCWVVLATVAVFSPVSVGLAFVPPSGEALAQRTSWSASHRIIGTTYFYWYRWPDLHFFDNAQHTDDALTDHFVSPSSVSMESRAWHKKEAADMIDAGIDMLWPVYWAAPGNFDHPVFTLFVTGLVPLQEALDELRAEGRTPPKVGLFYDTSSLLNSVRQASPSGGSADLTTPEGKAIFYGTIRSFFCTVHPRHWACINGRPIVVLYSAGFAANYDQSAFDYVNTQFAAEFGGITPYIIRERSWNVPTDSSYRWGAALHGPYFDGIAAVGAGYDDRAVPGRYTPIRLRENGNFYRWNWLRVLNSSVKIVHIETWNEMHEGTDICESLEYGRQYIDLTAHYAAHFKAGTVPDETVVLQYPEPVLRPPDMTDGPEYARAREVRIRADGGAMVREGVDPRSVGDGTLTVVEHAGDTFLRTDEGFSHRYAYFAVKDPFYYDQRRRAEVTIEYLNEGTATVQLQYDSYDPSGTFDGSYTNTSSFKLTNTGTMRTRTLTLNNARFANRQNSGSDFRYYVGGGVLYIKRVTVRVLDLPSPVLQVAAVDPPPGWMSVDRPAAVKASFSKNVQAASVNNATFRLTRSGGDGILGNANDVPISPASISTVGSQAVLSLAGVALVDDLYQIRLVARGISPILDTSGRVLDGRFTGTFPSGDGTGGEDFVATFTLRHARVDFDKDGDADQTDFGYLQACVAGSYVLQPDPACASADLDGDGDVDRYDLSLFLRCMTGANRPADLTCPE